MARRSSVSVYQQTFRSVYGVPAVQKMIAGLPDGCAAAIYPQLVKAADGMVEDLVAIIPVDEKAAFPASLRDSVRRMDGDTDLSVIVIEDGKDERGHSFAKHAEYGHLDGNGHHVAGVPHFWPVYRLMRKDFRAKVSRAVNAFVKTQSDDG